MHREKTLGNNKLCMTPGTLDTFEAPLAPRPKGQVTTRPRARKIPSIIRLGQRISKADMPAGALLFPSDRAAPENERIHSPWLRSPTPTRQWDPSSRTQLNEASPSKSTRDYAEIVWDGASEAEAFTQSLPRPAGEPIRSSAAPGPAAIAPSRCGSGGRRAADRPAAARGTM